MDISSEDWHEHFPNKNNAFNIDHNYVNVNAKSYCNINIVSLNVCGLVSKLVSPEFITFINSYDIVCLQETKFDIYDVIDVPGYHFECLNRKKCARKSGGIGIFLCSPKNFGGAYSRRLVRPSVRPSVRPYVPFVSGP